MNLHKAQITVSAVKPSQYPKTGVPEFAFAGRSNVGKSSLINKLLNRKSLARVSSAPGKTATINFYDIDETIFLVDLPGYGYATRSKEEIKKWGEMIESYLNNREPLQLVFLLVDSRHKPTADDKMMLDWIRHYQESVVVIATKTDKLSKTQDGTDEEILEYFDSLGYGKTPEEMPEAAKVGPKPEIEGQMELTDEERAKLPF